VPVPNGLLAPRVRRDALDGQVNFNEALRKTRHCNSKFSL
jgi:hypothetical protein